MKQRNSLPLRQGMLSRLRLHALIEDGLRRPTLVMLAGPGYGKTQAMADFLSQREERVAWLRLNSLDNLHSHFWDHLVRALDREFAGAAEYLHALGFPDTMAKFDAFLRFFSSEICVGDRVILVFDDFGEIDDRKVGDFFCTLAGADIENFRLVLISNKLAATDSAAFMASDRSLILGRDMRFTEDEIAELCRTHGIEPEAGEISEMERYTEGWPLAVHLLVLQRSAAQGPPSGGGGAARGEVSRMFEGRFFAAYPKRVQKLLVGLSLLNSFTHEIARGLCDGGELDLDELENNVFIAKEPAMGRYSFHNLYRIFLREKAHLLNAAEERAVWRTAAEYFSSSGDAMEAITCCRMCGDHERMLRVMLGLVKSQQEITMENADFFLEHLDMLTTDEAAAYPVEAYMRALLYMNAQEISKAEELIEGLEPRLADDASPDARALLAEAFAVRGSLRMTRGREDFGEYYRRAVDLLPEGTRLQNDKKLSALNNNSFFMADALPGAKERMERAVHAGVPWINRFMRGGMSGMEHIFSAEAAYLSCDIDGARRHAYRGIYSAEAGAQHDLACNGYWILARAALMQGDFGEMSLHVRNVSDYAEKYEIGALKEIRDTALAWYSIKLHDYGRIARSIMAMNDPGRHASSYDRSRMVYADYLIHMKEYARLAGMLEHFRGLLGSERIGQDRIGLHIMLAIAYSSLGKRRDAASALQAAYDMSYGNGLTAPFVEAGAQMRDLLDDVRQSGACEFAVDWLDFVYEEAANFSARAEAARAAYRKRNPVRESAGNPLTKRETEILGALSRGLTREEIAVEQFISINTVKTFIRSIYNKLDASNRIEAVSIAISHGYIDASAR